MAHEHIPDWAARCAKFIAEGERRASVHRLAVIIAHFAEPLERLLKASKREHFKSYLAEENDHASCPKSYDDALVGDRCTCGADGWNQRIEEVLHEQREHSEG